MISHDREHGSADLEESPLDLAHQAGRRVSHKAGLVPLASGVAVEGQPLALLCFMLS